MAVTIEFSTKETKLLREFVLGDMKALRGMCAFDKRNIYHQREYAKLHRVAVKLGAKLASSRSIPGLPPRISHTRSDLSTQRESLSSKSRVLSGGQDDRGRAGLKRELTPIPSVSRDRCPAFQTLVIIRTDMDETKIGVTTAAKILGVSGKLVQHLINVGRIRPLGKFGNSWVLDRSQIELLKRQREREALR